MNILGMTAVLLACSQEEDLRIRPFLARHCFECHGEKTKKADLRLDTLSLGPRQLDSWAAVLEQIESGEMPPSKKPRPDKSEIKAVVDWIGGALRELESARRAAEGRSPMRRMNRVEFANTLRDLLDIDLDVAPMLPGDGSAQGFDKVGTALSVSWIHLQSYIRAVDRALDAALAQGPRPRSVTQRFTVPLKEGEKPPQLIREPLHFWTQFRAPSPGRYRIRLRASASGNRGKPLPVALYGGSIHVGGQSHLCGYHEVSDGEPTTVEVETALQRGDTVKAAPYGTRPPGRRKPPGFEDGGPALIIDWVEVEGPLQDPWPPVSHRRLLGPLLLEKVGIEDAAPILRNFLPRAFRRPVSDVEVEAYVQVVRKKADQGSSGPEALRLGLKAALCSPEFLFLREKPGPLDDFSVASRLSYFLWSSMPDEELSAQAREGRLREPAILRAQVERMLGDPKSRAFTQGFLDQWLGLREIDSIIPDPKLYPEFDEFLKVSMVQETRLFFEDILRNDSSLLDFAASDYSILNERLARHYGIPGVEGTAFRKVKLPPGSRRGGLLTQASVLTATADGASTSPVLRGTWVLRNLLGESLSPPPSDVPPIDVDIRGTTTIRQQLEKHRQNAACASCHVKIDPPGFALESFDAVGGWREFYRNPSNPKSPRPVDPSDVMADGARFRDVDEFRIILLSRHQERIVRCVVEKLLTYSTGSAPGHSDRRAVDDLVGRIRPANDGLRSLIHEIVRSPMFLDK